MYKWNKSKSFDNNRTPLLGKTKNNHSTTATSNAKLDILSKLLFGWMSKSIGDGYLRELEHKDIFPIHGNLETELLGNELENAWEEAKQNAYLKTMRTKKVHKPSFAAAIFRTYSWKFFRSGWLLLLEECVFKLVQAYCIGSLIDSISSYENPTNYYYWVLVLFLLSFPSSLCRQHYYFASGLTGVEVASAISAVTFRKALKINQRSLSKSSTGHIINYLSNDVNGFIVGSTLYQWVVIAPLQLILIIIFLWFYIGKACLAGVALLFFYILFQVGMGKLFGIVRKHLAEKSDKRIKLTNEVIKAIEVIKMYVWEKAFLGLLGKYRTEEMKQLARNQKLLVIVSALNYFSTKFTLLLTFNVMLLTGVPLTASNVFVTMFLYNYVKINLTSICVRGIESLSQANNSCKRIQEFLNSDEVIADKTGPHCSNRTNSNICIGVSANKLVAKWNEEEESLNTIKDIDFSLGSGELLTIIGPTGSGKSSILQAVLNELPLLSGKLFRNGSIAYASQEPWIFNSSIRENILFGQRYICSWYETVIDACCLRRDFEILKYGDQTLAGEQGGALSGGQKARVNLARAVYANADIYLIDDPFSATDAEVGKHIFEHCIRGILKPKAIILVTHQIQFIKDATRIIVLNQGMVEASGTFQDIISSKSPNIQNLLKFLNQNSSEPIQSTSEYFKTNEKESKILSSSFASSFSESLGSTNQVRSRTSSAISTFRIPEIDVEQRRTKGVSANVYWSYIFAGTNWVTLPLFIILLILTQVLSTGTDYWLALWTSTEESLHKEMLLNQTSQPVIDYTDSHSFLRSITTDPDKERIVFGILVGVLFVVSALRAMGFYGICYKSSAKLYKTISFSLIRAPMSFYEKVQSGTILNRLSKDLGIMDDVLPPTIIEAIDMFMLAIGIIVLLMIGSIWLLVPSVVLLVCLYFLRRYFLRAGIAARRLEAIGKGSVYSHICSTLLGLPTIRSAQAEKNTELKYYSLQNQHTMSCYFCLGANSWLQIRAEWLTLFYVGIVSFTIVSLYSYLDAAYLGLCIVLIQTLGPLLQWGLRRSTEVDNHMISVERILDYSGIEPEPPLETKPDLKPSNTWPLNGRIRIENLTLRYGNGQPVLKNLTLEIKPNEKIGIVGRTGAGKSSLISTLFRLHELSSGSLMIDGVNIANLGLRDLRSKISIIPQDPTLFSGTLRSNLDPFGHYSDLEIHQALKDVQLVQGIDSSVKMTLDTEVFEGGNNFSVGQRQLLCLGRAVLCHNKILVLDEATANVDKETDALIQTTIRRNFENCTVITIAHRLNTVLDSDRILVLDDGMIKDFDKPSVLLQNPSSSLYRLAELTGDKSLFLAKKC